MRLDYKLLWVEDESDWVDTFKDSFAEQLYTIGFDLDLTVKSRISSCSEITDLDLSKYHLILMDFNLGNGISGDKVIESIRLKDIITEIIFYSADSELQAKIRNSSYEGIYWANRDDDFDVKVWKIIELTIRRVMDLPAMRGLTITETSDIDNIMKNILLRHHNHIPQDEQNKFRKSIFDFFKRSSESHLQKVCKDEKACIGNIDSILGLVHLDSYKKWSLLKSFIDCYVDDQECKSLLDSYNEILRIRNDLAHGYSEIREDVEYIIGKNSSYSLAQVVELRKKLLEQRDNFVKLLDSMPSD